MFSLQKTTSVGRSGTLHTDHGVIESPFFMPVGTRAAMRGVTLNQLEELGAQIMLCNTYHLHLRPGEDSVRNAGGLHEFINWQKPILTDSGGFQVFSLEGLRSITDEGVKFKSHIDGTPLFLGPKEAIHIQWTLGTDIMMCFDECPPSTAPRAEQIAAVDRTIRWARTCKETYEEIKASGTYTHNPLLFGIVQGGLEHDLRKKCAEELIAIGFDGYAIGGLAVGETEEEMYDILDIVCPVLPEDKPRYLMGVGKLNQLKDAVKKGVDMFDCVLPMREARHGNVYTSTGEKLRIKAAEFMNDYSPIDEDSPSSLGRKHSKAYLNHLLRIGERYGETIACAQNLGVTLQTMRGLRNLIRTI